jgi:D-alanyl-D-alanine carboxypeptidase/D-alanyl-D-alanine-endopeptidase (penicillin-binding protein 4)
MKKLLFCLISAVLSTIVPLFGANPVDDLLKNPLLSNANVSLLVKDLDSGRILYSSRPKHATIPASTMKLVTTATALELFGADFRFETVLEYDGLISSDSVLNGNLYIRGSGDPTLGSEKMGDPEFLTQWVAAVRKAGIKRINGRIVADASRFDDEGVNPKWTWDDIANYYAPGAYGISYLDNTMRVVLRSGKIDSTPEIIRITPEIQGLALDNRLKSTKITFDSAYFYGAPKSLNRSIYGEIPAARTAFTIKGEIPNPPLLLAQHLSDRLFQNGIVVRDLPTDKIELNFARKSIYSHFSPPLSQIITEINVKSNNHYAEQLFRSIALKNKATATTKDAIQTIRSFWRQKGLPVDQLFQLDGSGLTPTNAVSAQFFVDLLSYMFNRSKYKDQFYASMAVSGETGTLAALLKNTPLQGKVKAKSGTISRVRCYAGYIELKERTLAFALMVNNANGNSTQVTKKMEEFLLSVSK